MPSTSANHYRFQPGQSVIPHMQWTNKTTPQKSTPRNKYYAIHTIENNWTACGSAIQSRQLNHPPQKNTHQHETHRPEKNKYIEPPMHTQNAPPNQQCTHMMQTQIIQLVGIHQITKCSTSNYNLQQVLIMQISNTINPNPTTQTPSPRMVKRIARRNKESEKGIFCMGLCIGFFFEVMP